MAGSGAVSARSVEVARSAGFCFGVKRAIRLVEEALAAETGPVAALGPVIHNPQVVRSLAERGLRTVGSLDEAPSGTILIRSHGAPPHTYAAIAARGLAAVDATCPFVKKMHRQARQLVAEGYRLVIVGDRNHSEITSLTEDPAVTGMVVAGPEDLGAERVRGRVGVISQTTQSLANLEAVVRRLLPDALELRVFNTICDSTTTRQAEARELAGRVDLMVVIGGRNSANTGRLAEICRRTGTRTVWIETAAELTPGLLGDAGRIGVTAGASTPQWIIDDVIRHLDPAPAAGDAEPATPSRPGGIPHHRR